MKIFNSIYMCFFFCILIMSVYGRIVTNIPTDDVKVASGLGHKTNYGGSDLYGGLGSGWGISTFGGAFIDRFYLRFELPLFQEETHISQATLIGYHTGDRSSEDNQMHVLYPAASDSWDEYSFTWTNQPGFDTSSVPLGVFDASTNPVGSYVEWDVTAIADMNYRSDGILSLGFMETNDLECGVHSSCEWFASKEYSVTQCFHLVLVISPDEPATLSVSGMNNSNIVLSIANMCNAADHSIEYTDNLRSPMWVSLSNISTTADSVIWTNTFFDDSIIYYRIRSYVP